MTTVPRNKGSYFPRKSGTGYQVKYPLGWNEDKKKYDEYREDVTTEAEAISLIKAINDFVYRGGDVSGIRSWRHKDKAEKEADELTLNDFAQEFIEMRAKQKAVSGRTIDTDRESYARVAPYLGSIPLRAIKARDIDSAYARMRSNGEDNLGGRPYSGTSIQKSHAFLKMLFNKAVDYEYIDKNPCLKVSSPKRDTKEKQSLTIDEAKSLFTFIMAEPLSAHSIGVLISLNCGLRLSETLALQWKDIRNGSIRVTKSLANNKQRFKSTKTGEERTIPCPPPLTIALEKWKVEQRAWYKTMDLEWDTSSPVVNSTVGNHILQRSFQKWFARERLRYPIPNDFSFHGLRHTYVTLLCRDCGVDDRTTRSLSGHKSNQAFQIYTHTTDEWQRHAANELGLLLAPDDKERHCATCSYWVAAPDNAIKGACWAEEKDGHLAITSCAAACCNNKYSARSKQAH